MSYVYYTVSSAGSSAGVELRLYFKSDRADGGAGGDFAALCTPRRIGAADRRRLAGSFWGIRCLQLLCVAGAMLVAARFQKLHTQRVSLRVASGALGMANGAVFQLLPQRSARHRRDGGMVGARRSGRFFLAARWEWQGVYRSTARGSCSRGALFRSSATDCSKRVAHHLGSEARGGNEGASLHLNLPAQSRRSLAKLPAK